MSNEFEKILKEKYPSLSTGVRERVVRFRELMVAENEKQNLTRLISPADFWSGHVLDVKTALEQGFFTYPALDLGSGCGVPGLLAALIEEKPWVLVESEKRKAEFLARTAEEFGLQIDVIAGRVEDYLKGPHRIACITARAVGNIEKIYKWIQKSSTWNSLVLFKGPNWKTESSAPKQLTLKREYSYSTDDEKKRCILEFSRVPRGTK